MTSCRRAGCQRGLLSFSKTTARTPSYNDSERKICKHIFIEVVCGHEANERINHTHAHKRTYLHHTQTHIPSRVRMQCSGIFHLQTLLKWQLNTLHTNIHTLKTQAWFYFQAYLHRSRACACNAARRHIPFANTAQVTSVRLVSAPQT